jgi:hypothetical protein
MTSIHRTATAAAFAGVLALAGFGSLQAAELSPLLTTLKPMSGQGTESGGQPFMLNLHVGSKHTVGYFQNDNGQCALTLMVADAFNGEDVPNLSTVRFEVAIDPAKSARFDTADGRSLEFTCEAGAQELTVRGRNEAGITSPVI